MTFAQECQTTIALFAPGSHAPAPETCFSRALRGIRTPDPFLTIGVAPGPEIALAQPHRQNGVCREVVERGRMWLPLFAPGSHAALTKVPRRGCHRPRRDMDREGIRLPIISRQLGLSDLATTSIYLSGISASEIVDVVMARPDPRVR